MKDTSLLLESGNNQKVNTKSRFFWRVIAVIAFVSVGFTAGFIVKTTSLYPSSVSTTSSKVVIADTDVKILQYALILENLESAFYMEGMKNFTIDDFCNAGFSNSTYYNFLNIASHEQTHVTALANTIQAAGQNPLPACTYKFPYTDIVTFVALARALERTGVSAYDGAIHSIINDNYKNVGASIATVEARHAGFLNYISGISPFPEAFDTPLSQPAIVGIAAGVIQSCPFDLPIKPYPSFMANPKTGPVGTQLTLSSSTDNMATHCTFLYGMSQVWSSVYDNKCIVPYGVSGDSYVFLTKDNITQIVLDSQGSIAAGPIVFSVTSK